MSHLMSISSTFYEQLLRQYSFAKIIQSQTVLREKLSKALSYKKGMPKMLIKMTPSLSLSLIHTHTKFFYVCISFTHVRLISISHTLTLSHSSSLSLSHSLTFPPTLSLLTPSLSRMKAVECRCVYYFWIKKNIFYATLSHVLYAAVFEGVQ
jgi:hypothetical protein